MKKRAYILDIISSEIDQEIAQNRIRRLVDFAEANSFEVVSVNAEESTGSILDSKIILQCLNDIEKNEKEKAAIIIYDPILNYHGKYYGNYQESIGRGKFDLLTYIHPCFREPEHGATLWRYLTLPKFLDIIQTGTLYFSRADLLKSDDKEEGSPLTKKQADAFKELEELVAQRGDFELQNMPGMMAGQFIAITKKQRNEEALKATYINCWHVNESENFAMWKVYSEQFGVCIQTSYENLLHSFPIEGPSLLNENNRIFCGMVNYVDWNNHAIPGDNVFWRYIHKRREFSYENELRLIIARWGDDIDAGIKAQVNLEKLIQKIYINPYAPLWFRDSIINLCAAYGVAKENIIQSELS